MSPLNLQRMVRVRVDGGDLAPIYLCCKRQNLLDLLIVVADPRAAARGRIHWLGKGNVDVSADRTYKTQ